MSLCIIEIVKNKSNLAVPRQKLEKSGRTTNHRYHNKHNTPRNKKKSSGTTYNNARLYNLYCPVQRIDPNWLFVASHHADSTMPGIYTIPIHYPSFSRAFIYLGIRMQKIPSFSGVHAADHASIVPLNRSRCASSVHEQMHFSYGSFRLRQEATGSRNMSMESGW